MADVFKSREWLIFLLLDHIEHVTQSVARGGVDGRAPCLEAATACQSGLALVCCAFNRLFLSLPLPRRADRESGAPPTQDVRGLLYDVLGGMGITTLLNMAGVSSILHCLGGLVKIRPLSLSGLLGFACTLGLSWLVLGVYWQRVACPRAGVRTAVYLFGLSAGLHRVCTTHGKGLCWS